MAGDLINGVLSLAKQAAQMGLVTDVDSFTSIVGNQIAQTDDLLDHLTREIRDMYAGDGDLSAMAAEVREKFISARNLLIAKDSTSSLYAIKQRVLGLSAEANHLQVSSQVAAEEALATLTDLRSESLVLNLDFQKYALQAQNRIQYSVLLLALLCFIFVMIAGRRIRQDIDDLRQTNIDLSMISQDNARLIEVVEHKNMEVEKKNRDFSEINANLEHLVEKRTRTLSNILDNVQSGFFLVDRDLRIQEGFTKSCLKILGHEIRVGDTLGSAFLLDERTWSSFEAAAEQVFSGIFPDEVSLGQIQERYFVAGRVIRLRGKAIRSSDGDIEQILFTLGDITALEKSEKENRTNASIMNILSNRDAFLNFALDTKYSLELATEILKERNSATTKKIRAMLHTIKGNASVFRLDFLSELIHQIEDKKSIEISDIHELSRACADFFEKNQDILEMKFGDSSQSVLRIEESQLIALQHNLVSNSNYHDLAASVESWLQSLQTENGNGSYWADQGDLRSSDREIGQES